MPQKYTIEDAPKPTSQQPRYTIGDSNTSTAAPTWDDQHPVLSGLRDLGTGVLKGAGSTLTGTDEWARKHLPAWMTNSNFGFGKPADLDREKQMVTPTNNMQSLGKGLEQAGEFFIPGDAEEVGATKLATLMPRLGKYAAPTARVITSAVASGLVNKAQGGNFGSGAAIGGGGGVIGEGLRAVAPAAAEAALHVRRASRGFGRGDGAIGRAVLDYTKGGLTGTEESGNQAISDLSRQYEDIANKASVQPAPPVRGFLPPPAEEMPLHSTPFEPGTPAQPRILSSNRPMPREFPNYGVNPPVAPTDGLSDLAPGEGSIPDAAAPYDPTRANGMKFNEYVAEPVPGRYNGAPQPQGVYLRRPPMSASIPPATQPANLVDLFQPQSVFDAPMARATSEGAQTRLEQMAAMRNQLEGNPVTGAAYPRYVTPRQGLDIQRGYGDEVLNWNPDLRDQAESAGRQAYHSLGEELDKAVPQGAGIRPTISTLIPAVRQAKNLQLNAGTMQRVLGRVGAHSGALAGALAGGTYGYHEGGLPGMFEYGMGGLVFPELMSNPDAQLYAARMLNNPGPYLNPLIGGAEQTPFAKPDKDKESK